MDRDATQRADIGRLRGYEALWTVEGADKANGRDVVQAIDAPSEDLARATAVQMGILVAEIHRSTADPLEELQAAVEAAELPKSGGAVVLDYSTVKKNPSAASSPSTVVAGGANAGRQGRPEYWEIVEGAKWLRAVAVVAGIFRSGFRHRGGGSCRC